MLIVVINMCGPTCILKVVLHFYPNALGVAAIYPLTWACTGLCLFLYYKKRRVVLCTNGRCTQTNSRWAAVGANANLHRHSPPVSIQVYGRFHLTGPDFRMDRQMWRAFGICERDGDHGEDQSLCQKQCCDSRFYAVLPFFFWRDFDTSSKAANGFRMYPLVISPPLKVSHGT